jgi:hypothetical protein
MRFALLAAAAIGAALAGCAKEIEDPRSAEVDCGDPKSVTASIFYAADTGRADHLGELCDPAGAGASVRRICAVRPRSPDWESFRRSFARGRLNGEPRISGDRARLDFVFGPGGDDSETMELVRRGGCWYLSSF